MKVVTLKKLQGRISKNNKRITSFVDRFWKNVDKRGAEECWPWRLAPERGYGKITIGTLGKDRQHWMAHRMAYLIFNGSIRVDLEVLHSCDNPICQNPSHLTQGTHAANMNDAKIKGRIPKGEDSGVAVLTNEKILSIRAMHVAGETASEIARRFKIGSKHCWNVIHRRIWRHI